MTFIKKLEGVLKQPLWLSLFHALFVSICMAIVTWLGMFHSVKTEDGLEHYAEHRSSLSKHWLVLGIAMPLNTFVNLGYVIIGCYLHKLASKYYFPPGISRKIYEGDLKNLLWHFAYCAHLFGWMACIYGPIQFMRIVTQKKMWSVLDQWYTLPFFMWVCAWTLLVMLFYGQIFPGSETNSGTNPKHPIEYDGGLTRRDFFPMVALMTTSIFSYSLTLLSDIGFEITLMAHVLIALLSAVVLLIEYSHGAMWRHFFAALLACAGFILLKLADLSLPNMAGSWNNVFTIVSGHFLSKLCDIAQIYFVALFFFDALRKILEVAAKLQ